jgi:hypothetical protein
MIEIASWNVNSIRARLEHVTAWLKARKPDIGRMLIDGEIYTPSEATTNFLKSSKKKRQGKHRQIRIGSNEEVSRSERLTN